MENKNIKKKITNLIKKIRYLEYKYFILNETDISNYKYDQLLEKLNFLEKKYPLLKIKNSPTKYIGKSMSKDFNKIKIITPMLSLKSIYSLNKLLIFIKNINKKINNIKKIEYCCEYKLDGLAVNLLYIKGKLIYASTRGNGIYGEDITYNIKYVNGIPLNLKEIKEIPYLMEIRGEICISYKNFFKMNDKLKIENKKQFSNPRNASSGLIRQIKFNKNNINILDFFGFSISKLIDKNKNFVLKSQFESLKLLILIGFKLKNKYKKYNNKNSIINFYKKVTQIKKNLKYPIDGIVIKIDSIYLQNKLGLSSKFPNWSIALKFKPEEKITKIKNIKYKVGRTGIITPIAELDPIIISGVLIKKISLSNTKKIIDLDLRINDYIIIKRSGDVIPTIKKNIIEMRNDTSKIIEIPKYCPECKNKINSINKKIIKCQYGILCKAQKKSKIIHFFSKNAIYAKGIGEKTIKILLENKKINSQIDLFELNFDDLIKIPSIKEKKAFNIIKSLNNSKNTTLDRFIYALGIDNVGINSSLILSKYYKNISNFINEININNLIKIKGINKKTIISIKNFLNKKYNIKIINNLLKKFIKIK